MSDRSRLMHGATVEVLIAQTQRHGDLYHDPTMTEEHEQVRQRRLGLDPSRQADPAEVLEERCGVDLAAGPGEQIRRRNRGPGCSPIPSC